MTTNLITIPVPIPPVPYGVENQTSIYVRDSDGNEKNITGYYYSHKITQRINELWFFDLSLLGVSDDDKLAWIIESNEILIFHGTVLRMKGRIAKISYDNLGVCEIEGVGMAIKMKNTMITAEYLDTTTATIVTKLASQNLDSAAPWIMSVDTNTDYGIMSIHFYSENRLKALAEMVDTINFEWWEDWKAADYYVTNYINVSSTKSNPTVTKLTLYSSGPNQNMHLVSKEDDTYETANYIEALGYGDGVNQLKSINYNATDNRSHLLFAMDTILYEAVTAAATSIKVYDASGFSSGDKLSMEGEWMVLTGTPVAATGYWTIAVTRAQSDDNGNPTTAAAHPVNTPIIHRSGKIYATDTSSFPAVGDLWVGQEKVHYSAKSDTNNTFTLSANCRGTAYMHVNVAKPYVHGQDVEVYDAQYTTADPEAGSYIAAGLQTKSFTDTTIIDQNALDIIAQNIRAQKEDLVKKIEINVSDPYDMLAMQNLWVGDYVEVVDTETGLAAGTRYEIVGMTYGFNEDDGEYCTLELGNKDVAFVEDMQDAKTEVINMSGYYKGATNVFQIQMHNRDDCTTDQPAEGRFYVPPEAVGINKVALSYIIGPYVLHLAEIYEYASEAETLTIEIDDGNDYRDVTSDLEAIYGTLPVATGGTLQDVDITSFIGREKGWKGVKIIPHGSPGGDGRAGIKGDIFIQMFVQSKIV